MNRIVLCGLLLIGFHTTTRGQEYDFGFKAGVTHSRISNLSTIILSEPYFINYSIAETGRTGWHLGIYYDYNLEDKRLGFQSEIMYARQGANVEFGNFERDFHYKMIAVRLGITLETVRQHIKNIYRKLQVNSKGEVIVKSLKGEI